jgi:hypothetical protein
MKGSGPYHEIRWNVGFFFEGGTMKRVRAEIEVTRRTSIAFDIEDDADSEEIKATALEEAELAEWDEDPPEVVSIQIIDPS